MKFAIIGGGMAGLATAIALQQKGYCATVYERAKHYAQAGLGFILLPNGLEALQQLGLEQKAQQLGVVPQKFISRLPNGTVKFERQLPNALVMSRLDCLNMLAQTTQKNTIEFGHKFNHFEYDTNGKATAAHFDNGKRIEADLFVATDGSNSTIRSILFPEAKNTPVVVKELVGIVHCAETASKYAGTMLKTQSDQTGLSIGILPCNGEKIIWYLQIDANKFEIQNDATVAQKRRFALDLVGKWADPINHILQKTDFDHVHLWQTTDLEPLQTYYKQNTVLLGDAAHTFLTFTSQGVNSALEDAVQFAQHIDQNPTNYPQALQNYTSQRKQQVDKFTELGRLLVHQFLNPNDTQQSIPLVIESTFK